MDYQLDLPVFRGPFDLLLYLVKRHEVDVFDIPIAVITEQYLRYLEVLQQIDVEQAGEFLVMASTLMEIKSRMLLPQAQAADAEAAEDPQELVQQLVAYKKYRDAAQKLEDLAEQQAVRLPRQVHERPEPLRDPGKQPLEQVELWDLVSAFDRLLRATLAVDDKTIVYDDTPQLVHIENLLSQLAVAPRQRFEALFTPPHTRGRLVGLFLAILELIKDGRVTAEQESAFGEFWIVLTPPP